MTMPRSTIKYDDFMAFGTFDMSQRPGWDENYRVCRDEDHTQRLKQKAQLLKQRKAELGAITGAVREVMGAYSPHAPAIIKNSHKFSVPVYLNNHEIHAWRTLSNLLTTHGHSFSFSDVEGLAELCRVKEDGDSTGREVDLRRFRFQHPEVFHFVCYCNLLLGGTKSFASARFTLLWDLAMLLRLIQQVAT